MLKDIVKEATAISPSMSNTILASLSWSGATRGANAVTYSVDGNTETEVKPFMALAGLANRVTAEELRPTTEAVLNLLKTEPEVEIPTNSSIQLLKDAGEDVSKLEATLKNDHEQAMQRHAKQVKRMTIRAASITQMLDEAFAKTTKTIPTLDAALEEALISKVLAKVNARRSRLVVDIASGRNLSFAPKELAAINYFLKSDLVEQIAA